jgi:hypothetical protein
MFQSFAQFWFRRPQKIKKVNFPSTMDSPTHLTLCMAMHNLHNENRIMQRGNACIAITYRPKCLQEKIASSLHKRLSQRWEMP